MTRRLLRLAAAFFAALLIAAGPAQAAGLPVYHVDAHVDAAARQLRVKARIQLPASTAARNSAIFKLRTDMGTPVVEALGSTRSSGPLTLRRLKQEGSESYWEVTPRLAFPAGRPVNLHIRHAGGSTVNQTFYVGPEVVFVGGGSTAWYPQYEDGRGLGSLTLRLPTGFRALASPSREHRHTGAENVARFTAEKPTQFSFIAGHYTVREERFGARRVRVFLLSQRDFADDLINVAGRSIEILEREFGPYPFGDFSIAEVPSGPGLKSGFLGAAFDGYMLMRSDLMDARQAEPSFFGHEVAHQWWGVSIQNPVSGDGEYMLDEALAHYGALRVFEALAGPEAGMRFRRGDGHLDGVADAAGLITAGFDRPLAALPPLAEGAAYYELSHTKGGLVYDLLSRQIGRDRFAKLMRDFAGRHAYSQARWKDFRSALSEALGPERSHLLDQWFDRKGLPVISHRWSYANGQLEIATTQTGEPYALELPVRLTLADDSRVMRTVDITGPSSMTQLPVEREVVGVELDPMHTVPWITPAQLAAATDAAYATRGRVLWDSGRSKEAEAELRQGLASRTAPASGPGEFLERYYLGWIVHDAGNPSEALALLEGALRLPVRVEEDLPQLYWRVNRSAAAAGDVAKARWAAAGVLALGNASANLSRLAREFLAEPTSAGP
jgi:hypothetical protein